MAADRGDSVSMLNPRIVGRSSSHYTRLARIFALELGVVCDFSPVYDLASRNPADYAGNPALKLPVLTLGETVVFGAENICRTLAEQVHGAVRVVWTEDLPGAQERNAQELVWHAMQAQVQLVFGTQVAKLPAENMYFEKAAIGLRSALAWLDAQVDDLQHALPPRDLSLVEASLFCLWEHLGFRVSVPVASCGRLAAFAETFRARPSAQATPYAFDVPPG